MNTLRHIGLVVKDIENMKVFYTKHFGFEIYSEQKEYGEFLEKIIGESGAKVQIVKMALPQDKCLLELLKFYREDGIADQKTLFHEGMTHFAITVDNVKDFYLSLRSSGVTCLSEPCKSPDGKACVVFCRDPEGNFIELVEELN